jgi:hypothetical protein
VRIINEKATGKPFEIDAAGVFGDAEMLLKARTKPAFRKVAQRQR